MSAPLYDALKKLSRSDPTRLHMPGHKGLLPNEFSEIASLDFTEIAPTGNLYTGEGPIREAELLFAKTGKAKDAMFFSCGSTQGLQTILLAAVGMNGTLLLDRGCHKSVYNVMGLLDITPVYLTTDPLPGHTLPSLMTAKTLEAAFSRHPEATAFLLTTPSYYGVLTDLVPLADVCHRHNAYLLVDQAHGAHFPFVGLPTAVMEGADLAVISAHKTLPALGSSSVLYLGNNAPWTVLELKAMSSVFATTSPSYPILASIDYARELLETRMSRDYLLCCQRTATLRQQIQAQTDFSCLMDSKKIHLDPCRLTIDTLGSGFTGYELDTLLQQDNIYVEMADERYVVCIFTCCDSSSTYDHVLERLLAAPLGSIRENAEPASLPPLPEIRCSIRTSMFGSKEYLPLKDAAGRISAEIIAPYPPGIPVLAPGEEITEKHIAYLQKKSYNVEEIIGVVRN